MRELKFRLWYYDQKKFDYDIGLKDFSRYSFPLHWCYVQQYTGLQDSNGQDIYEGDVVKAGVIKGIVSFESGAFFIGDETLLFDAYMLLAGQITVIGNVLENSELLK